MQFKQDAAMLTLKLNVILTTSSFYSMALRDPGMKQTRTAGQSSGENLTGRGMGLPNASKPQLFRTLGKHRDVSVAGVRTDHRKCRGQPGKDQGDWGSSLGHQTRPAEGAPASHESKWRFMPEPGYKVFAVYKLMFKPVDSLNCVGQPCSKLLQVLIKLTISWGED